MSGVDLSVTASSVKDQSYDVWRASSWRTGMTQMKTASAWRPKIIRMGCSGPQIPHSATLSNFEEEYWDRVEYFLVNTVQDARQIQLVCNKER